MYLNQSVYRLPCLRPHLEACYSEWKGRKRRQVGVCIPLKCSALYTDGHEIEMEYGENESKVCVPSNGWR